MPLSAIRLGGGTAPRTAVVVQRRFPALYWDTLSDGRSMCRTARAKAAADRMAEGNAEKVCSRLGPACLLLQVGAMHNYFVQALESGALLLEGLSYRDVTVDHAAGRRGCCGADPGGGEKPL